MSKQQREMMVEMFATLRALFFGKNREKRVKAPPYSEALMAHVHIPIVQKTREQKECRWYFLQGQYLARQERWGDLADLIEQCDGARVATPSGLMASELMASGARSDFLSHAAKTLENNARHELRQNLHEFHNNWAQEKARLAALLVQAHMHIDLYRAWLSHKYAGQADDLRFHQEAAAQLWQAAQKLAPASAAVARLRVALLASEPHPQAHIVERYAKLIHADPTNALHMRTFGRNMLPDRYGSTQMLETQARRLESEYQRIWGKGGTYFWVYFDALLCNHKALERADLALIQEGIDNVTARKPEQHVINLIAAFCAQAYLMPAQRQRMSIIDRKSRDMCKEIFDELVLRKMSELHPDTWYQVADLSGVMSDCIDPFGAGKHLALRAISMSQQTALRAGAHLHIGEQGAELRKAA